MEVLSYPPANMNGQTAKLIRQFVATLADFPESDPRFIAAYRKAKKQYLSTPRNLRASVKETMRAQLA